MSDVKKKKKKESALCEIIAGLNGIVAMTDLILRVEEAPFLRDIGFIYRGFDFGASGALTALVYNKISGYTDNEYIRAGVSSIPMILACGYEQISKVTQIPGFENTYDSGDIVAYIGGALVSYLAIRAFNSRRGKQKAKE